MGCFYCTSMVNNGVNVTPCVMVLHFKMIVKNMWPRNSALLLYFFPTVGEKKD